MRDKMAFSSILHQYKSKTNASTLGGKLMWAASMIVQLPFLFFPRQGRPVRMKALHEMHPLDYLTGLRGYLAITIFTGHVMKGHWKWIPESITGTAGLQFPFRGGYPSLCMFFWISGYTIMYKIVGLMQARKTDLLLDNLSSLAFRRYMRLLLPILPVMLVTDLLVCAGIANMPDPIAHDSYNANIKTNPLWHWISDIPRVLNPVTKIVGWNDGGTGSKLLEHTWSLPAEFRSSMMLCVLCLATCKLSTRNRKLLTGLAIPAFVYWQAGWAAMAWSGMLFAERRQERQRRKPQEQYPSNSKMRTETAHMSDGGLTEAQEAGKASEIGTRYFRSSQLSRYYESIRNSQRCQKAALLVLFLYSLVYIKDPKELEKRTTFPHNIVNSLIPSNWHSQAKMQVHLVIGCTMLLYALDLLQELQRPLLAQFSQFLGELSFGIYAVHPTIRWIMWESRWVKYADKKCGAFAMDYFWCVFPGYFAMLVCVLWASEAFRRVDMQVVRLCKWLESQLFEK